MRRSPPGPSTRALCALLLAAALSVACADAPDAPTGPPTGPQLSVQGLGLQEVDAAIAAQERHTPALLRVQGVVGTAVGFLPDGGIGVRIFLARPGVPVPAALDGIPTSAEVTGRFVALADRTSKQRPAPLGFSVGHPDITAGTIGARVLDGAGNVYVLSNNHVLANSNEALIGDPALQPGPFDGGTLADQFGTLSAFEPIAFDGSHNTIDAAIAVSSTAELGNGTPSDEGYGTPNAAIFGDADGDGFFDDVGDLLGVPVQKYGRTTGHTRAQITGINATVDVCYEVSFIWCTKLARFVDQEIIGSSGFSDGGDSGSLIVTDDENAHPVGLLFAGSDTETIANRIDLVLNSFGVTVDGSASEPPPPPDPVTDVAVSGVAAPSSAPRGQAVDVTATVSNVGNQDVTGSFTVTLEDATDAAVIGSAVVDGLAAGASADLPFTWDTNGASLGDHVLVASHDLTDDDPANDQASTTVSITDPSEPTGMHVGDLDGGTSNEGSTWSATVEVTVHDADHLRLNGATVVGEWSQGGFASDTCTTGELGGDGTCVFLLTGIRKRVHSVTFTVTGVTAPDRTYEETLNHDPDGSSDGTTITVSR